jgi:group I intron endonuclease
MWYVYKLTNTVNNKLYIGITTNPSKRWETHLLASKDSQKPLYQSIRKYGVSIFTMEIICSDIMTEQAALLLEADYIKKLNTLVINRCGYNILAISGGRVITNGKFLCSSCGIEKEVLLFSKCSATVSGLTNSCKECIKEKDAVYYSQNKDAILDKKKDFWIENQENLKSKKRNWYQNNKEIVAERNKDYNNLNKDTISIQKKEYYLQNETSISDKKKEYWLKNKDAILARRKKKKAQDDERSGGSTNN